MERIATVTINSTSVSPRSPRLTIRIGRALFINSSVIGLLHLNVYLPPVAGNCCCVLLTAPGRVMAITLSPAVLAWKVRTQTTPVRSRLPLPEDARQQR